MANICDDQLGVISVVVELSLLDRYIDSISLGPVLVLVMEEYPRLKKVNSWTGQENPEALFPLVRYIKHSLEELVEYGEQVEAVWSTWYAKEDNING